MKELLHRLSVSPLTAKKYGDGLQFFSFAGCALTAWMGWWALFCVSGLALALGVAIHMKYWRCPECGQRLPMFDAVKVDKCPNCGAGLE
ncbi:MAG TPA: hypothetical protein IAB47_05355 [Candidatus Scatomorpha merdigallinarum]|mgnify:CR=1 FL=1|nr:hypothetical protein [Candidatus Scatomorpha merdigallinarum]